MEQTQYTIINLVKHPESMNRDTAEWLRDMVERYPYYQTARLLFLENLYRIHDITFDAELRNSALLLADRSVLFNLVESENYVIPDQSSNEETEETKNDADRTLSLIDGYLNTLTSDTPKGKAHANKTPSVANVDPSVDYMSYLMNLDEEENDDIPNYAPKLTDAGRTENAHTEAEGQKTSKSRISLSETPEYIPNTEGDDLPNEDYYTEKLAQIFIKQKNYKRALEIIKVLEANNPEKNRYFAEQIRFLGQLIAINNKKK